MTAPPTCFDEERLYALARGPLDDEARRHLDGCDACRSLLGHTLRSLRPADRDPAPIIGRYVIQGIIGAGAMGVVYRARDPVLGRGVAVKVLRTERFDARQLHEAEALARLSHPNVVTVYDAGRLGERVFIAMELVEGETLAAWLSAPRTPEEILRRFSDAGAGLQAAHAAGLVHRDFKPHNVLCGHDGRVRVADFGLARVTDAAEAGAAPGAPMATGPAGTPAYMAPEQLAGGAVDARTDQFGFCVALHEAIYGARPFTGDSSAQLYAAISSREVQPPRRAGVPTSVRRALSRGLSKAPADRHPSMQALLDALRPGPRRAPWLLGGAAALSLLGVFGWRLRLAERGAQCAAAAAELDAAWDGAHRDAAARAFARTGLPYADAVFARTASALDLYAATWRSARVEACAATLVRGEQSLQGQERRVACLADRREELAAVTALLGRADATVVDDGAQLVEHLAPVGECAAPGRLSARRPRVIEPRLRSEADDLARVVAGAWVEERLGRTAAARAALDALWPRVRALGHLPLEAEAHLLDGRLRADVGDSKAAIAALEEAASAGDAGRDDEAIARARIALVEIFGVGAQDRERGLAEARYAEAALERLGGSDRLEGDRQLALARVARSSGHSDEALAAFAAAELHHARAFGDGNVQVAETLAARAGLYEAMGRHADAVRDAQRALAIEERVFGALHPSLLRPLLQLGVLLATEGKYEEARATYRRALDVAAATIGERDSRTATIHAELGQTLARLDRSDEAERELRIALEISERTVGPSHADTAAIRDHLGVVFLERGDAAGALGEHVRALAIFEAAVGAEHPRTGRCLHHLAADELALGHAQKALAAAERARAIIEQAYGKDARDVAVCLTLVGQAALALGDPTRAVPPLERALALREARHASPRSLGETRFALGQAIAASDRPRSLALVRQAANDLATDGSKSTERDRAEVARWLAKHHSAPDSR